MVRTILPLLLGLALTWNSAPARGQELRADAVYRVDPNSQQLVATPTGEIKPGYIYKYFHPRFQRHVWGFADTEGGFVHAFGPGSRMPTTRFDLRISSRDAEALVEERIPGLAKSLERLGQDVLLRLNADDRWEIYPSASVSRHYDLATLRRWEWHGARRVAVVHTHGLQWRYQDGRYLPVTAPGELAPRGRCCP